MLAKPLEGSLQAGLLIEDWIVQAGMDWEILESPVLFVAGELDYVDETKPKTNLTSDVIAPFKLSWALMRTSALLLVDTEGMLTES